MRSISNPMFIQCFTELPNFISNWDSLRTTVCSLSCLGAFATFKEVRLPSFPWIVHAVYTIWINAWAEGFFTAVTLGQSGL